ncbi:biopolymer transporter ExbD [Hydrogenophaga aquatica]
MPAVTPRGRGRRTMNDINMVPFIDVMLVLLIIFMVTAPLITPSMIDLPSVGQAARQPDRYVQVIIDKDARLQVKDGTASAQAEDVSDKALVQRVRDLQGAPVEGQAVVPVVISADKSVKYEAVINVMDQLQKAGIQRVGLSVQQGR